MYTKSINSIVVSRKRVTKVISGGRCMNFSVFVVVGDYLNNTLGIGKASSKELYHAILTAKNRAMSKMFYVPVKNIGDSKILKYNMIIKHCSTKLLFNNLIGHGIVSCNTIKSILSVIGVTDAVCKVIGSTNIANILYAFSDYAKNMRKMLIINQSC